MFLFIFETKRNSMSRGRAEREEDSESEAGSRLWAVSTEADTRLELTDCEIMTWAEVRRLTNWATPVPQLCPTLMQAYARVKREKSINWWSICFHLFLRHQLFFLPYTPLLPSYSLPQIWRKPLHIYLYILKTQHITK